MARGMAFWSVVVPGGKEVTQELENEEGVAQFIHVTSAALAAENPEHLLKGGIGTLYMNYDGINVALCTLGKEAGALQYNLDLVLDQGVTFKNTCKHAVHISGYLTVDVQHDEDDHDEDDEDEESEDDEDDDDEDVPDGVPLTKKQEAALAAKLKKFLNKGQSSEEGTDDMDEDGIPDMDDLDSDDMIAEAEDSDDEGEDDDEDEEGEEDDDEEEDEEQEQEPTPQPKKKAAPAPAAGSKRPAAATPDPKSSKALKADGGAKVPASAPPKTSQPKTQQQQDKGIATPSTEPEYKKALVDFLKKHPGPINVSAVGSAVRKPEAMKNVKLGEFLVKNNDVFDFDKAKQTLKLKK